MTLFQFNKTAMSSLKRWDQWNVRLLLLSVVVGACSVFFIATMLFSTTADVVRGGPIPPDSHLSYPWVETVELHLESVITLPRQYTGLVKAARTSELGFKRTGRMEQVFFQQGDRVTAGEILASLDVEILNASRRELAAQLRGAQAVLQELISGPRQQTIELARTEVGDLEAQFAQAEIELKRYQRLQASSAVSQQEFEEIRLRVASVEERLKGAKKRLEELEEGTRLEKVEAQRAEVARLEAALSRLDVDIAESQLVVPYDGVISQRMFDEGAIVGAGAAVFRIVELDRLEAWIGLPTDMAASISYEDVYRFQVNRTAVYGRLIKVLPELDALTRTQTVRFELLGDQPMLNDPTETGKNGNIQELQAMEPAVKNFPLVPGQLIRIELHQTIQQTGFWLPLKALAKGRKGLWTVYVAAPVQHPPDADTSLAMLMQRDVEIIQIDSHRVYVRGALVAGEQVVVSGLNRLTPGQMVRLATPTKTREDGHGHFQ